MIRILHAADLHLDLPFASLTPELAAERRRMQRKLPQALTELCVRKSCDLLLLAGDVFDGSAVCPETIEALQNAFAHCPVPIFISPGNHDPYTAASPWATYRWPENVHIFTGDMASVTLPELRCRVWGAAFRGKDARELLQPVPRASDGFLEIGVFHGDPVYPGDYHYITPRMLEACGLDYLALGHIHKTGLPRQAGKTWYGWPGVTMGRGFDETGETGVFLLEADKNRCEAQWIPLPTPKYEILKLPAQTASLPAGYEQTICRLVLTGEAESVDTAALYAQWKDRFLSLELRDETTPPQALWDGCGDGTLRGLTLEALKAQYDAAATPEERQILAQAATYARAALEGRDVPW